MKKILLIIPIVLVSVCVSCQKAEWKYLKGIDKDMVPYQWGESYRFVDGKADTITLKVCIFEDAWRTDGDAEMEQQYRKIALSSSYSDTRLLLFITGQAYGDSRNSRSLSVSVWPSGIGGPIDYNMSGRFIKDTGSYWYQHVHDSLLIGDQIYYNIAERVKPDSYEIYYNKAYGVLQVKSNDKIVLQRIP